MRNISFAATASFKRVAAPRMPKMTSASTPSRSMSFTRRSGSTTRGDPFAVLEEPRRGHDVDAMILPGHLFVPGRPHAVTRPNECPFLEVQYGPSGPSVT